jgi:mRNA interferase YafQ
MPIKYQVSFTTKFKKQRKLLQKQGRDIAALDEVITLLASGQKLPEHYQDHALRGKWAGFRDCHVQPDWLLIYRIIEDQLTLILCETGSHSELLS